MVQAGFNDLTTTHPHLAAQAEGWDPSTFSAGSNRKVAWKCHQGHLWKATIGSRSAGSGCPICSNRRVLRGRNDLGTLNPKIASEASGWDPTTVTPYSNKKKLWLCSLGHQYHATVAHRSEGKGCPFCSGQQVLAGFNDLTTTHPHIAAEAYGWNPQTISAGSHKRMNWKCPIGHVWDQVVKNRTLQGFGCSYCSGKRVLKGFNDLATTHPDLASEALNWDPATLSAGSHKKVKWQCSIGHVWTATPNGRRRGEGCPSCSKSGFDPNRDGWLYLVYHEVWDLIQVGLTNHPDNRLNDHRRTGFSEVLDVRGPMKGELAQTLEAQILRALKTRGANFSNVGGGPKFDGYSESWTRTSLNVINLKQILEWIYEDESSK